MAVDTLYNPADRAESAPTSTASPKHEATQTPLQIDAGEVVASFEAGAPLESNNRGAFAAAAALMGAALFASGAAGLINQVVWQRSLKVFLGGSETVCSTVVVLVFMAGLGIGSLWMGRRARRAACPLRRFAFIESLLAIVNLCVCGLLAADLTHSVFAFQQAATSLGAPLLLLYGLGALAVLFAPCFLMGATMPLAAEACQRNLGLKNSRMLGLLFFVNTAGSVAGTLASSGWMIPHLGLTQSLVWAAAMNLAAGVLLVTLVLARRTGFRPVREKAAGPVNDGDRRRINRCRNVEDAASILADAGSVGHDSCSFTDLDSAMEVALKSDVEPYLNSDGLEARPTDTDAEAARPGLNQRRFNPSHEEVLACGLGFCSLAFEMYLFRLIPLRHEPLPFTFAAVLAGFLTFWSLGAALSSRKRGPSIPGALRLCALCCVATVPMFVFDVKTPVFDTWSLLRFVLLKTPYFIPCVCFGYLFGRVAAQAARSWGDDVGRIYGWNTAGSCAGIVAVTFVGYETPFFALILAIGLVLYAMQEYASDPGGVLEYWSNGVMGSDAGPSREWNIDPRPITPTLHHSDASSVPRVPRWAYPLVACAAVVASSLAFDLSGVLKGQRMFSGRDGAIIVTDDGDMIWDGLWHSALSVNGSHVGTNNWHLAVAPVLSHSTGEIEDVCVIGVGTGVTASTLAKLETVEQVDAYDISTVLKEVYDAYPEGTLGVATNPKVNIIWQDARTGLALNSKKYDLIQTQPLYLKQAGSGLLNSVEFMRLVQSRLKKHGVFCLYSNGTPAQALAVRETADRVFPHRETFKDGYLLVLSNEPIPLDEHTLAERLSRRGPLWDEIRAHKDTADATGVLTMVDRPRFEPGDGRLVITDDRPIIEYPHYLREILTREVDVDETNPWIQPGVSVAETGGANETP